MDIQNLIDKLNNELEKINRLRNEKIDTNSFFTNNVHFNDDILPEDLLNQENSNNTEINSINISNTNSAISYKNTIEPDNETKSLVVKKESSLFVIQNIFKKSIKFSLKSFLISISLSFLNLFI